MHAIRTWANFNFKIMQIYLLETERILISCFVIQRCLYSFISVTRNFMKQHFSSIHHQNMRKGAETSLLLQRISSNLARRRQIFIASLGGRCADREWRKTPRFAGNIFKGKCIVHCCLGISTYVARFRSNRLNIILTH